ncbi:hypothetical protein MKW98_005017 [Papaver atlanticum]|uniref:Uncharacterized protein n=1 Tax=Papaver atlanticum TaxID=357466 RepID=A0AAD4TDA2_9MAGN|nr:hypothetical protein MKW98_005017 [Papaver atlanticum]
MIYRRWSLLTGPPAIIGGVVSAVVVASFVLPNPFVKEQKKQNSSSSSNFAKSAAVMNISGSFPQTSSSVSLCKVSRVGFASNFNVRKIAAKEMKCRAEPSAAGSAADKIDEGIAKATELSDDAKAKATRDFDEASAKKNELEADAKAEAEKVKSGIVDAGEKAKENVDGAFEAAKDKAEAIKDAVLGKE